jgi:undecaprenyl-diphosphatase
LIVMFPSDSFTAVTTLVALLAILLLLLALFGRWFMAHRTMVWQWTAGAWQQLRASAAVQWIARRFPWMKGFIGQRLSAESYLGLHLTVGILLSLAALWVFSEVAEAVAGQDDLTRFDLGLARSLHQAATPVGIALFTAITWLGSFPVMLALGISLGLVLLGRGQRRLLIGWVVGLAGGSLLNLALKTVFQRPRPQFDVPVALASGWSFPSGHAMGSLIGYGLLAYVLLRFIRRHWARVAVVLGALLMVLLIGFSRLYLGVHFFSDVIGGYAAGTVWLSACVSGLEAVRRRRPSEPQRRHDQPPVA